MPWVVDAFSCSFESEEGSGAGVHTSEQSAIDKIGKIVEFGKLTEMDNVRGVSTSHTCGLLPVLHRDRGAIKELQELAGLVHLA